MQRPLKKYSNQEALSKLMKYCAYQERCHFEVEQKLWDWGFFDEETRGNIVLKLLEHNFLNEERFARAYVRGKFNIKQWGKIKIKYELKQKKISDNLIKLALEEIDDGKYLISLEKVIQKKAKLTHDSNDYRRKQKIANYAIQKGYEPELIWKQLI